MLVVFLVIGGAVVLGLVGNLLFHDRILQVTNRRGIDAYYIYPQTNNVYGPTSTLLALFIAFVLFAAADSYSRAQGAVKSEAAVVTNLMETAEYLPNSERRSLQRSVTCYARAVAGPEWDALRDGSRELSPEPSVWTGTQKYGIRRLLLAMGPDHELFETVRSADEARGDARRARITEAAPSIPGIVMAFMITSIALTILFLAMVSPRRSVAHSSATILAAFTLVFAVFIVRSLDRPYAGTLAIEPTQMHQAADDAAESFVKRYGEGRLLCDRRGNPTGAARS